MPAHSSRSTTATSIRILRVGVPLVAAGLITTACSSSGGGGTAKSAAATSPAATASASTASAGGLKLTDGHLTDASGRTVYLWVADTGTMSSCSGSCAAVWPAVPASGTPSVGSGLTASLLTTTKRSDGSKQLDYAGHPLYYFESDTAVGDALGQGSDGFGAKWWEVNAAGKAITSSSSSASSSGGGGGGYGY